MSPVETSASVFPEEDLRDELVARGEPIVTRLGHLLARFDVKASDRAAVAEIEEWFEELGIGAEPGLLDEASGRRKPVTLYMREWGPPAPPGGAREQAPSSNGAAAPGAGTAAPGPGAAADPALAAQLARETGMPVEAAAGVIGEFDPASEFVTKLRARALESTAAAPKARRRRTLRIASWVMFAAGGLLLLEAGVTVLWQEPFSAIYSARAQAQLEDKLERLEGDERAREGADKRRLLAAERRQEQRAEGRISSKRKSQARVAALADSFARRTDEGKPLGEVSVPKMGLKQVMVQGTEPTTLRKGPGHYKGTTLPGQNGTVGIAGHRTTYSAPFKKLNELKRGDEVFVKVPYGVFTYRIEGTRIIDPDNLNAFRRAGYNRVMLTACHPVFSDKQRIIAWGRLEEIVPRGAAVL